LYEAIQECHAEGHGSIVLLCQIAHVTRAAYYKWLSRKPSQRDLEEIKQVREQVNGIYGYRRMTLVLNRKRQEANLPRINEKRIYRLMKATGLQAVIRRKRKSYRQSTAQHIAENVLNRAFTANRPNEKWCTDVTEVMYGAGKKAYISAILDLYDGSIVSYVVGHSNNNDLVFTTLKQAMTHLKDGEQPLLHSDRGYQYTSKGFKRMLEEGNITQSMSRVGRCLDNAPIESFWGSFKCEKYYLQSYESYEALKTAIDEYMFFYHHHRYQARLNGLSPIEFRTQAA